MITYTLADLRAADFQSRVLSICGEVARLNPEAWREAHNQRDHRSGWFNDLCVQALRKVGIYAGRNGKRGGEDLSDDVLVFGVSDGIGEDTSGRFPRIAIIDYIQGAGGPNPSLGFGDVTAAFPKGRFLDPEGIPGVLPGESGHDGVVAPSPPVIDPPRESCQYRPCGVACKAEPCSITPEDIRGLVEALTRLETRQEFLFDQLTKRIYGLPLANGQQEPGVADLLIRWLQSNRVRVRF